MFRPATGLAPSFAIGLGDSESEVLDLGLPVLGGPAREILFPGSVACGTQGALRLGRVKGWLIGGAVIPVDHDLERATAEAYRAIFEATGRRQLVRCWNYVPAINRPGAGGLENYRVFCRGRSLAFESRFGAAFNRVLPSASAVGAPAGLFAVVFAACDGQARHIENPLQVPAYEYPPDYGPRPPSFSRATMAVTADETRVFISGTSAIRGHATIAPDRTSDQLDCTLQNLRGISAACHLGPDLARGRATHRHFKVYLRRVEDYAATAAALDEKLLADGDVVTYLQADICREALNIEIEATVTLA